MAVHAVIMAGGSGTRFWPQSRQALPKQFLNLAGEGTLIQQTANRSGSWIPAPRTWVVTGALHAVETGRQLPDVSSEHILVEPTARNTAPCVGLAALQLVVADPDAVMLVMPADHVISPSSEFVRNAQAAASLVAENPSRLVLFGVKPNFPATGFGYMHRGAPIPIAGSHAYAVEAFKEKPDLATAEGYVASGQYYWNCGIFVWRAQQILDLLKEFTPAISEQLEFLRPHVGQPSWAAALERHFPLMQSISIDYAVLEKASSVCVLEASFGWDDVGSWQSLPRLIPADAHGNTVDGLFCGVDTSGCIVRGSKDHLIATIGIRDCIVVHTPTATLVADKHDENAIRTLIAQLKHQGLSEYL